MAAGVSLSTASGAAPAQTIDQVQQEIAALQTQADVATEAFDAGRIKLATDQKAAAAADAAVTRQEAALRAQSASAGRIASAQYRDGGLGKLLTFVGSGDASVFLDNASTLSTVSNGQAAQLMRLRAATKQLTDARSKAGAAAQDSAATAGKLNVTQSHIQSLLDQQRQVLASLQAQQRAELAARQAAADKAAADAAASERARVIAQAQAATQAAADQAVAAPPNSTIASPSPRPTRSTIVSTPAPAPPPLAIRSSDRGSVALAAAYAEVGKPYVYGAAGPDAFDCSGLMLWSFAKAGISLPHSAAAQYGYGTHIPVSQLQPGDIVFFEEGGGIGHNGIYAGNGTMVDAPHTGTVVGVHALYPGLIGGTRL